MEENKNEKKGKFSSLKGFRRAVPILLIALTAFLTFCFMTNGMGLLGDFIAKFLLGAFSWSAYFIPAFIALHALFYPSDIKNKRIISRTIFSTVTLISIAALIHSINYMSLELSLDLSRFYSEGTETFGGGFVGGLVAFLLSRLFGKPGVVIISIVIILLYITFYFASGRSSVSKALLKVLDFFSDLFTVIGKKRKEKRDRKARKIEEEQLEKRVEERDALLDDEFFAAGNGMQELTISDLGVNESRADSEIEKNPPLHDRVRRTTSFDSRTKRVYEKEEIINEASEKSSDKRRRINLDYSTNESKFGLNDRVDFEAFEENGADIIYEEREEDELKAEKAMYGLDENAEDVFTKDFNAYDFKINEEVASKKSTKGHFEVKEDPKGIDEFSEPLIHASEDAIEKARARADFEMRKKAVLESRIRMEQKERTSKIISNEVGAPVRHRIDDSPVSMQFDDGTEKKEAESTKFNFESSADVAKEGTSYKTDTVDEPFSFGTVIEDTFEFGKKPEFTPADAPNSVDYGYTRAEKSELTPASFDFTGTQASTPASFDFTEKSEDAPRSFDFTENKEDSSYSFGGESVEHTENHSPYFSQSDYSYTPAPEFKPYDEKASADVFIDTKNSDFEDTAIRLSRTMLNPTPEISEEPEYKINTEINKTDSVFEFDEEEDEASTEESSSPFMVFDEEEDDEEEENSYAEISAEEDDSFDEEIPEEEQNEDVKNYRKMFNFLDEEVSDEDTPTPFPEEDDDAPIPFPEEDEDSPIPFPEEDDDAPVPFPEEPEEVTTEPTDTPQRSATASAPLFEYAPEAFPKAPTPQINTPTAAEESKEEKPKKPDYSDYKFPPIDLLIEGKSEEDPLQSEERAQNAEKLIDTLNQFGVKASIKGIDHGPRITRYEIVPARGVKVNQITNLFDDIALNMAAEGIRMEAPIPGKSAIGVEIPNKHPSLVLLRDLVESDEFTSAKEKTTSCLGKDVTGNPVFCDIAKMPHMLIAGATGMGKSVCINSILLSILYKARPDEVKFIMIDPKKVEFNGYNGIPHLLVPVVTDVKQAAGALTWAVEQMEKRYELMEKLEVRKLDSYNERVREDPSLGEPLPKIIIVIDELNDIMLQVKKPAEDLIMSIAQKARAAGIHLIIGTQRPSVDVITGVIKANIPSRIACKVASFNDSKTILEQAGAEKLLKNGDMLYIPAGAPKALRVQGAYVSDPEIASVMKFLKSQVKGAVYDEEVLADINRAAQKCSKGKGSDDDFDDDEDEGESTGILNDQQFLDAVELAIRQGKISTSLIQRKISIGYGKAAKFIDYMEEMGLVSEPNGQRPRDVLVTKDEWHEMLARRSLD